MLTPKKENFSEIKKSPQVVATEKGEKVRVKAIKIYFKKIMGVQSERNAKIIPRFRSMIYSSIMILWC